MQNLFSKNAAAELLNDEIPLIGECLYAAVDRFNSVRAALGPVSARSQASLINDYAAEHASAVFTSSSDVSVVRCQELPVLNCGGLVCVRFKKLASGWAISRNDTIQTQRWEAQSPLAGMEAAANLTAAYRLDDFGREIETTALVYHFNRRYQWHIDIPAPGQVVSIAPTLLEDAPAFRVRSSQRDERVADDA